MAAGKRQIINKTFSLLRGAVLGRLKIYRAGPDKDICASLELEFVPWKPELRKTASVPAGA